MKLSSKANLYLLLATLMWGVTFPLIRNALHEVDAVTFVFLRFMLAALVLLPFSSHFLKKLPLRSFGGDY
ncbi:EamA family transporter [Rickettsiella massiliensis]